MQVKRSNTLYLFCSLIEVPLDKKQHESTIKELYQDGKESFENQDQELNFDFNLYDIRIEQLNQFKTRTIYISVSIEDLSAYSLMHKQGSFAKKMSQIQTKQMVENNKCKTFTFSSSIKEDTITKLQEFSGQRNQISRDAQKFLNHSSELWTKQERFPSVLEDLTQVKASFCSQQEDVQPVGSNNEMKESFESSLGSESSGDYDQIVISDLREQPRRVPEFKLDSKGCAIVNFDECFRLSSSLNSLHEKWLVFKIIDPSKSIANTIATVKVNAFLLAIGPQDCRIALIGEQEQKIQGILQFKCPFQQHQKVNIALDEFKMSIQGLVPTKIKTYFKIKVPTFFGTEKQEVTIQESLRSDGISGKFLRFAKTKTKFDSGSSTSMRKQFEISYCDGEEVPQNNQNMADKVKVSFDTSLENLFNSTIRLYLEQDYEDIPIHNEAQLVQHHLSPQKKLNINFSRKNNSNQIQRSKPEKSLIENKKFEKIDLLELEKLDVDYSDEDKNVEKTLPLEMLKTKTEGIPKQNNVKRNRRLYRGMSTTHAHLHQKMNQNFLLTSLNFYGNSLGEKDQKGQKHLGKIYLTVGRLLNEFSDKNSNQSDQSFFNIQKVVDHNFKDDQNLINKQPTLSQKRRSQFKKKSDIDLRDLKAFKENIYMKGKKVGNIKGKFKIDNIPKIQQMSTGVITETGIQKKSLTDIFLSTLGYQDSSLPKAVLDIKNLTQKIVTQVLSVKPELQAMQAIQKGKVDFLQDKNKQELDDIIKLMKKRNDKGKLLFPFSSPQILLDIQLILIDFGVQTLKMIKFLESKKHASCQTFFNMLALLLQREELGFEFLRLDEHNLGLRMFQSENQGKLNKAELVLEQDKKIKEMCLNYHYFLCDCFLKALKKVQSNMENTDVSKSFIEQAISISFSRFPEFQWRFAEFILEGCKEPIQEWVHFGNQSLEDGINKDKIQKTEITANDAHKNICKCNDLFEWNSFHTKLEEIYGKRVNAQINRELNQNNGWSNFVKSRTGRCFQIINFWIQLLQKDDKIKKQTMKDIPGFCAVIRALLQELKHKNFQSYQLNVPMIETTILLSKHDWFVPVFIEIILPKINAFQGRDVAYGMTLISQWLQQCENLPTTFEYKHFGNLIIVLDEKYDHDLAMQRTLLLLYHNLQKFPVNKRMTIFELLISKQIFYRLFFHWSFAVRKYFYKLILFQLEYFFIIKTCNMIGLNYEIENYFDTNELFKSKNDFYDQYSHPQITPLSRDTSLNQSESKLGKVLNAQYLEQRLEEVEIENEAKKFSLFKQIRELSEPRIYSYAAYSYTQEQTIKSISGQISLMQQNNSQEHSLLERSGSLSSRKHIKASLSLRQQQSSSRANLEKQQDEQQGILNERKKKYWNLPDIKKYVSHYGKNYKCENNTLNLQTRLLKSQSLTSDDQQEDQVIDSLNCFHDSFTDWHHKVKEIQQLSLYHLVQQPVNESLRNMLGDAQKEDLLKHYNQIVSGIPDRYKYYISDALCDYYKEVKLFTQWKDQIRKEQIEKICLTPILSVDLTQSQSMVTPRLHSYRKKQSSSVFFERRQYIQEIKLESEKIPEVECDFESIYSKSENLSKD